MLGIIPGLQGIDATARWIWFLSLSFSSHPHGRFPSFPFPRPLLDDSLDLAHLFLLPPQPLSVKMYSTLITAVALFAVPVLRVAAFAVSEPELTQVRAFVAAPAKRRLRQLFYSASLPRSHGRAPQAPTMSSSSTLPSLVASLCEFPMKLPRSTNPSYRFPLMQTVLRLAISTRPSLTGRSPSPPARLFKSPSPTRRTTRPGLETYVRFFDDGALLSTAATPRKMNFN